MSEQEEIENKLGCGPMILITAVIWSLIIFGIFKMCN